MQFGGVPARVEGLEGAAVACRSVLWHCCRVDEGGGWEEEGETPHCWVVDW